MATIYKVDCPNRKPLFEGVQGENEARSIQFDITAWVEELGAGAVTATAKRPTDAQPYPVTIEQGDGNIVTWKPTSTDTAFEGVGSFQLEYTVDDVLAKTCIWSTQIAPSLDPAGDPPDPYDNWLASMREVAAAAQQSANDSAASAQQAAGEVTNAQTEVKNAEAWAVGTKGGVDVPTTDETYHNNAKYWAEKSNESQYGAYITKSASGSIASFNDGADNVPMKSVKVAIVPKQAGSGDPSPSNVRPITGTSTANVFVMGKNLFDKSVASLGKWLNISGGLENAQNYDTSDFIKVLPNTGYYLFATGTSRVKFYDENKTAVTSSWDGSFGGGSNAVITTGATTHYVRFSMLKTNTDGISFNYPSTDTAYHAYNGHTTPVPLGQTVYGGEVDVTTGAMTIDMKMVDIGTLTWGRSSSQGVYFFYTTRQDAKGAPVSDIANMLCSNYLPTRYSGVNGIVSKDKTCAIANSTHYLYIRDDSYTDAATFKAAMSGVQLVYELATPTTIQLTPAQVATLLGQNNVWSDAGDVEVEYRADPTLAYAELQALILENN